MPALTDPTLRRAFWAFPLFFLVVARFLPFGWALGPKTGTKVHFLLFDFSVFLLFGFFGFSILLAFSFWLGPDPFPAPNWDHGTEPRT